MDKCYVNVCGGIGNQLFQVANGFAYSQEHNKELLINATGWSAGQGTHPDKYKDTIFKNFKYAADGTKACEAISEKRFNYDELPYISGDVSLNGYFQSVKYFEEYAEEFEMLLHMNFDDVWVGPSGCVGVHVRRGDYLGHTKHNICDRNYFEDAFKYLQIDEDEELHIYTDSPEHVAAEFKGSDRKISIIEEADELLCLNYLACYDNLICSNSSFSWWASKLGRFNENILVPSRWFNDFEDHGDIYMDNFTKIKV